MYVKLVGRSYTIHGWYRQSLIPLVAAQLSYSFPSILDVFEVMLYGFYHGIHHHFAPPFEKHMFWNFFQASEANYQHTLFPTDFMAKPPTVILTICG